METIKKYLPLVFLILISSFARAQSDLEIRKVYEEYGKKKGVTMVELNGNMLEEYNFTIFKSISITDQPTAGDFIRKCLSKDETGAKKVKQVLTNGKATSIILQLAPKNNTNRIILFNESGGAQSKITLVYIETDDTSDALKLILKKK